jgi:ribose transport system ATP-binding protein
VESVSASGGIALELDGVSKSFLGVRALADASLVCHAGEVHALVGENGAGKSTLIKVASGALVPDAGAVRIGGQQLERATPATARRLGLLTAYQDTSLVPAMTVAENMVLSHHGVTPLGVRLRPGAAAKTLAPYDLPFGPDELVSRLSPGSRQLLEVVRALVHHPKVLLLDEPTAALDAENIQRLEALIDRALGDGAAILYISHRLDEVQRIAARLTVIRDGRIRGTYERGEWSSDDSTAVEDIVTLMVGARTDLAFPPKPGVSPSAPEVLEAKGFRGPRFGPVSLHVRAGEVIGIAGADGNGQRELVRSIVGLLHGKGDLSLNGTTVDLRTPSAAIAHGVTFVSGDRVAESAFRDLSVMENSTISLGSELGPVGLVLRSRQKRLFRDAAEKLGTVFASPDQPVAQLSGGNQQKAVLSRAILRPSPLLVVDEPTQGVDARARLEIYRALRDQAAQGTAIVVNSSESAELEGLCDRVYVISRGRVVRELTGADVKESTIVESFVNIKAKVDAEEVGAQEDAAARAAGPLSRLVRSAWLPMVLLVALTLALGAYTASRSGVFLSTSNLSSLFVTMLPLAAVAFGQQFALLTAGFDISVGSTMSLVVVVASFWATSDALSGSLLGLVGCLGVGVLVGLLNGFIIRVIGINAIVATIATFGIILGVAILVRPTPDGAISIGFVSDLSKQVGPVPVALIVLVALAVGAELWMRLTTSGLKWRAAGLHEEASRRTGLPVQRIKIGAYVMCSLLAAVAGLLLAVQVGIGDNSVGANYALPSFTACFLGGAALTGGRGSFVGVMVGALFLSLLTNATPLVNLPSATSQVATGVLTIAAVIAYAYSGRGAGGGAGRRPKQPATGGTGATVPGVPIQSGLLTADTTQDQVTS